MATISKDTLQKAGDYILSGPMIIGGTGKNISITNLVSEINIYQDIDTPYMSGSMFIMESAGIYETLPILGQERLLFKLETPGSKFTIDFSEHHAMVYSVQSRNPSSNRQHAYSINFTTQENFTNIRTKISKSFKGTIDKIVAEIMTDDSMVGTPKAVNIDPTINNKKFIAPNMRPFQVIQYLKEESISKRGEPHYVFFENPEGFHFRSLDSMLGELGELSNESVQHYKSQPPKEGAEIGDIMQSIQEFRLADLTNTFTNSRAGMFASTLYQHDIMNKNISKYEFSYEEAFKSQNATNQPSSGFGPLHSNVQVDGKKQITEFPNSKIFVHPSGSNKLHNEGSYASPDYFYMHNNAEKWMQESTSRELEREYFTINISVWGNTDIKCGDIINISIPANRPLSPSDSSEALDKVLTGRYLITSLHHKIDVQEDIHVMFITAMTDSIGVRAVVQKKIKLKPHRKIGGLGLKRGKKMRKKSRSRTPTAIVAVRG